MIAACSENGEESFLKKIMKRGPPGKGEVGRPGWR
jgi:hypothetical protein